MFDFLREYDVPFESKRRYRVELRKGTITVEPDATLQGGEMLMSIKRSIRERWKQDIVLDAIPTVKRIILITADVNYRREAEKYYDQVFVFPRDRDNIVAYIKTGSPVIRSIRDLLLEQPN